MPPFPGDPKLRSLLAVHSTRNGVPMEDRIRDGTSQPVDQVDPPASDVPRETPVEEPEAEPPPAAARRRR